MSSGEAGVGERERRPAPLRSTCMPPGGSLPSAEIMPTDPVD
jgi:hypothetical protein